MTQCAGAGTAGVLSHWQFGDAARGPLTIWPLGRRFCFAGSHERAQIAIMTSDLSRGVPTAGSPGPSLVQDLQVEPALAPLGVSFEPEQSSFPHITCSPLNHSTPSSKKLRLCRVWLHQSLIAWRWAELHYHMMIEGSPIGPEYKLNNSELYFQIFIR
jgi:hypothetical protein